MAWWLINNLIGKDVNSCPPNLNNNEVDKFFSELGTSVVNILPPTVNYNITSPFIPSTFVYDEITVFDVYSG